MKREAMDRLTVLAIWEDHWEKLSPVWRTRFMTDSRLDEIRGYPPERIARAIRSVRRLDSILALLRGQPSAGSTQALSTNGGAAAKVPATTRGTGKRASKGSARRRDSDRIGRPMPRSRGDGSPGFYRMPRERKPEAAAGVCNACGVRFGYDGRCGCS